MATNNLVHLLKHPLTLLGLCLLGVNLGYSYSFFHINSFKLLVALVLGLVILAGFQLRFSKKTSQRRPTGLLVLLALPLLASIPGAVMNQFGENYNFAYELGSTLIVWVWAYYLFQFLSDTGSYKVWFGWLSVVLLWTGLWGLVQGFGFLIDQNVIAGEVKSNFGHRNYFASYLVLNIPLFVMLVFGYAKKKGMGKLQLWYMLICCLALGVLYLTRTRAASVALGASLWLVFVGYSWFLLKGSLRKKWLSLLLGLALIGVVGVVSYGLSGSADPVYGSRYEQLFSERAWIGRILPWQVAWEATLDAPAFGQGLGSYYNQFFLYQDAETRLYHPERSYNHAHSEPLEILSESGFVGAAVWCLGLFWVGRSVFRALKSETDPFERCIVLGLGGGILASLLQGSFSVAPRMLVSELPFTLHLAALFALEARRQKLAPVGSAEGRNWSVINTLAIGIAGLMLIPWLQRQHQYTLAFPMPETPAQAQFLEKVTEEGKDIYALDHLLHLQARFHRTTEMAQTIKKIDALIPHYRDVDYQKAVWAVLIKKMDLARSYAQKSEEVDRYYLPNLRLLMNIAIETDDFEGFSYQFGLMTRLLLFHKFVIVAFDENAVPIKGVATRLGMEFVPSQGQLEVRFDPAWLRGKYDQIRKVRQSNLTTFEQRQLMEGFTHFVARNPFFRLEIRPDYLAEEAEIFQGLNRYKRINRELGQQESYLRFSMSEDLKKAPAKAEDSIRASYQKRFGKLKAQSKKKLALLETQLDEKAQFYQFINKHKFAAAWLSEWQLLFFPNEPYE